MTELDKTARYDELRTKESLTDDEQAELDALTAEFSAPPTPGPITANQVESTGPKRYAAYNKTLERFVGGVFETRKEAQEVVKHNASKHKFEIREV